MDRLELYRQTVRTFLEEYAQESVSPSENVTAELVFDEKRDRYLLVHVGWQGARRIYGCPMQIDIIDNKVWLQHNATEVFVDQELIARGIPEDDIVLGLQSPRLRELVDTKKKSSLTEAKAISRLPDQDDPSKWITSIQEDERIDESALNTWLEEKGYKKANV